MSRVAKSGMPEQDKAWDVQRRMPEEMWYCRIPVLLERDTCVTEAVAMPQLQRNLKRYVRGRSSPSNELSN